jgi:hypothetical protein
MSEKEKIYRLYLESVSAESSIEELADNSGGDYNSFSEQLRELLKEHSGDVSPVPPKYKEGDLFSLLCKDEHIGVQNIEYVMTNICIQGKHLVYKVSPYVELAGRFHLLVQTDLGECLIELDNPFLIDGEQLESSLYEGSISNPELIKSVLCGQTSVSTIPEEKQDSFSTNFSQKEKELVSQMIPANKDLIKSFQGDNLGSEINFESLRLVEDLTSLPHVASLNSIPSLLKSSARSLLSSTEVPDLDNLEFGDNYKLVLNNDKHVIIAIDQEYQGKLAVLKINNKRVFYGYLWKHFDLGVISQEIDLKALNTMISIEVDE